MEHLGVAQGADERRSWEPEVAGRSPASQTPVSDEVFFSDLHEIFESNHSGIAWTDLYDNINEGDRFAPKRSPGFHTITLPGMTYWPGEHGLIRGMLAREGKLARLGMYLAEGYAIRHAAILSRSSPETAQRLFRIMTTSGKTIYCGCGKPSGSTHTGYLCDFRRGAVQQVRDAQTEWAREQLQRAQLAVPPIDLEKARNHFESLRWGTEIISCVHCKVYEPDAVFGCTVDEVVCCCAVAAESNLPSQLERASKVRISV